LKNHPPLNSPADLFGGGRFTGYTFLIIPLGLLLLFFFLPVLSIFRHISWSDISENLQNTYYRSVISFTFMQAAVSTLSAVLLGLPGAWIMSHVEFRGRRLVNSITTVPFVLPSVLVVLGFVLSFGNAGILNTFLMKITGSEKPLLRILYSFKAIILAHTFYNFPITLRLVSSAWKQIGRNRIEAAQCLGAGRIRIFATVIFPSLLPSIIASASLVFIFCFMSFAVILVLGGGPQFSTIEVEIYRLARINLELGSAASLALLAGILTALFTWIYIRLQKAAGAEPADDIQAKPVRFGKLSVPARLLIGVYLTVIIVLIIGPLAAVAARSFQDRSGWSGSLVFSFKHYAEIFRNGSILRAVRNSILIASAAVLITLPAGFSAAMVIVRGRLKFPNAAETIFMLPMGVSAVVIGLGYYSLLTVLPPSFQAGGILIVFAHSVIALPFAVRSLSTGLRAVRESLLHASATLGAGFFRTLRKIELPLLKNSLISAAAFVFCISAGEINAALILTDGGTPTIPIMIYRLISSYQFFGACALGTVLMIICGSAFYLIDRYGGDDIF